jgi:Protein of unknown function (DUF4231)
VTATASISDEPDSGYLRLEAQLRWYDSKSQSAQRWYKAIKFIEFVCAALVPFVANISGNVTALLGAVVLILETLQQLNQWHSNWITYRSTCEALRHEKYSYLGGSGPYDGLEPDQAKKMLVERVEALISTEHAKWISRQEYDQKKKHQKATKA